MLIRVPVCTLSTFCDEAEEETLDLSRGAIVEIFDDYERIGDLLTGPGKSEVTGFRYPLTLNAAGPFADGRRDGRERGSTESRVG